MELFDLTLPLWSGMPVYPGDPHVSFTPARSHEADGYQVTHLCLGSHTGTHLDAPRHFFAGGATLDEYPLDRLVGPGVVVDCRPVATPHGTATPPVIDAAFLAGQLRTVPVPHGGLVLLWTEGAFLAVDAARLLLDSGAGLVGTDAPSLDEHPYPVHRLLLSHGVLLAENLCGLYRLGSGPVTCAFLPLAALGADAAPVRAVAWR